GELRPAQAPPTRAGMLGAAQVASRDDAHLLEVDAPDDVGLDASVSQPGLAVLVVRHLGRALFVLVHRVEYPGHVRQRGRQEPGEAVAAQVEQPAGRTGRCQRPQVQDRHGFLPTLPPSSYTRAGCGTETSIVGKSPSTGFLGSSFTGTPPELADSA